MRPVHTPPEFPDEFYNPSAKYYNFELRLNKEVNVTIIRGGGYILYSGRSQYHSDCEYRVTRMLEFPISGDVPIVRVAIREKGFLPLEEWIKLEHNTTNTISVVMQDDLLEYY